MSNEYFYRIARPKLYQLLTTFEGFLGILSVTILQLVVVQATGSYTLCMISALLAGLYLSPHIGYCITERNINKFIDKHCPMVEE